MLKTLIEKLVSGRKAPVKMKPVPTMEDATRRIASIRGDSLSYCGKPKLENIAEAILTLRQEGIEGDYLEAGVALGGSAILIGHLKPQAAALALHDVFAMIPPPGERDGEDAHKRYDEIKSGSSAGLGGNTYYGYVEGLQAVVEQNLVKAGLDLERDHIACVPGLFEDALHPTKPLAFAHIDCDWFDSVQVCIERIVPQLVPGGIMIFDDYSSYSGCRRAVDAWLEADTRFERLFHRRSLAVRLRRAG